LFWSMVVVGLPLGLGISLLLLIDNIYNMDSYKFVNAILWINMRFSAMCIFTYVACELMALEFKTEVLSLQWTMSTSRSSFYMAKIIFLSLWSLVVTLLSFAATVFFIVLVSFDTIGLSWLLESLVYSIMSSILTWPIMYFTVWLTIRYRRVWLVMSFNMLVFILGLLLTNFTWSWYIPWLTPVWILFNMGKNINYIGYLIIMAFTLLSLFMGHRAMEKVEV